VSAVDDAVAALRRVCSRRHALSQLASRTGGQLQLLCLVAPRPSPCLARSLSKLLLTFLS
jgi:hypothetical protein